MRAGRQTRAAISLPRFWRCRRWSNPASRLMACHTVEEERNGSNGSIYMLNEVGLTADYEITAEPTAWGDVSKTDTSKTDTFKTDTCKTWGMNLSIANSGHCLVEVTVRGVKSHIWRPDISINAIMEAAKLLPNLQAMAFSHTPSEFMGHTPPCCS